ncbi:MAG TPA: hypothetical protein VFU73_09685 [Actinocrinis sp.]|nr:hypothetical protein [Actinocrinis sp.]
MIVLSLEAEDFTSPDEKGIISMLASLKRAAAAVATVGLCAAGGVLAAASPASASTGDWGWPQRSTTISHGTTDLTTFGMLCLTSAGCTAQAGTTLTFTPQAGAVIADPNGAVFPFFTSDTFRQVGTCMNDFFGIQCTLASPVSLAYGSELFGDATGSDMSLLVPDYLPAGATVGEFTWFDPNGMSGTNLPTETISAVVNGV